MCRWTIFSALQTTRRAVRKLAAAATGYTAALIIAHYILPSGSILWCAAGLASASLLALLFRGEARLRALLIILSAALGFVWYWGFNALFISPVEKLVGETLSVTAKVTDYSEDRGNYSLVYVRLTEKGLPRTKVAVYDRNGRMQDLKPGDIINAELEFTSAMESYGEETDVYSSRGVFIRAYLQSAPEEEGRTPASFIYFPKALAKWVESSVAGIFSGGTVAYMKALLIGSGTDIYSDYKLYNALGKSGILHTVAVSGMHLAYLWGFLSFFFRSKRRAAVIGIPAIWVFALMTGFTPSVVRSAFMLTLVMTAPLIRRESDGVTSLSAILLILLIVNPISIGSASLQLSFAAMAGIILFTPRIYSWFLEKLGKEKAKFPALIIASLSSSLGAIVFTTPLCALRFGYVSLISPITNLLILWAVSVCFIGGYIALAIGALFIPLGISAAWLVSLFVRYITYVAGAISALPFSAVYTSDNLIGWWLAFSYAIFLYSYFNRGEGRFRPTVPVSVSLATLSAIIIMNTVYYNSAATITAIDVGQGQSIAVLDGSSTMLIDCGGGGTWENAGDTAADYLLGCGRTRVDFLVLTHLHADHAGGVTKLLSRIDVEYLALPADVEDEYGLRDNIINAAEESGTEIINISEDTDITVGGISARLYAPIETGDENERGVIILTSIGNYDMIVTGDVNFAVEGRLVDSAELPDAELLIVGHHGSRYSTSFKLLEALSAETAIISVGWNNYGHPTDEVLWRLAASGMETLRTDELKNISIRINQNG